MKSYRHVVVALDLDDHPEELLKDACELNERYFKARLDIVHVCDPQVTGYGELMGRHHINNEMQVRQKLFPQLRELLAPFDVNPGSVHVLFGKVADSILQFTLEYECDLLILGGHGRSGWWGILGATDTELYKKSQCDVLALKYE